MLQKIFKKESFSVFFIVLGALFLMFLILEGAGYYIVNRNSSKQKTSFIKEKIEKTDLKDIERKNNILRRKIERLSPTNSYIVIDTANNILYLKKGSNIILQALISCGSGNILEEPNKKRKWIFDTPRGEFVVRSKIKDPTWIKPDWAFIEEAEAIPKDIKDRIEEGVLGDYALGFGDGYFIHGTLYARLLGRNVTHGCIRVGDEDLRALFKTTSIGTRIYIF